MLIYKGKPDDGGQVGVTGLTSVEATADSRDFQIPIFGKIFYGISRGLSETVSDLLCRKALSVNLKLLNFTCPLSEELHKGTPSAICCFDFQSNTK